MSLTKRQRKILDYLSEFSESRGYAPSLMEIAQHFGLRSPATVHKHLHNLELKGAVRRRWNHTRSIEVLPEPGTTRAFDLTLAGTVASDQPPAMKPAEQPVPVPAGLLGDGRSYVLRVVGDGFRDDLIRDGDLLVLEERPNPPDGAIVLVVLRGARSALRRVRVTGSELHLGPVDGSAETTAVDPSAVRIQGRVVGILRRY